MNKNEFYNSIEQHLRSSTSNSIQVVNGGTKLAKTNTTHRRFSWGIDDVIEDSGSVGAFIESLKTRGFGTGSQLELKKKNGSSDKLESSIDLKFTSDEQQKPTISNNNQQVMQQPQQQSMPMAMAAPNMGYQMQQNGNILVTQSEWLSTKIKEERYNEVADQLRTTKGDLEDVKSELRTVKEAKSSLERKLETIADRHLLEIERIQADKKTIMDTETGKEIVKALPQLASAFLPKQAATTQPPAALGYPAHLKNCVAALQGIPPQALPLIEDTLLNFMENGESYIPELIALNEKYSN